MTSNPVLDVEGLCERLVIAKADLNGLCRQGEDYIRRPAARASAALTDAASALRTLAAERDEAAEARAYEYWRAYANALQSRLLKAVEGLESIASVPDGELDGEWMRNRARRALQSIEAESGGEGDEPDCPFIDCVNNSACDPGDPNCPLNRAAAPGAPKPYWYDSGLTFVEAMARTDLEAEDGE